VRSVSISSIARWGDAVSALGMRSSSLRRRRLATRCFPSAFGGGLIEVREQLLAGIVAEALCFRLRTPAVFFEGEPHADRSASYGERFAPWSKRSHTDGPGDPAVPGAAITDRASPRAVSSLLDREMVARGRPPLDRPPIDVQTM
jgi:hypothetical protein